MKRKGVLVRAGERLCLNSLEVYIWALDSMSFRLGAMDTDTVTFAYIGLTWSSLDENCGMGGYSGGEREMDCTFFWLLGVLRWVGGEMGPRVGPGDKGGLGLC